MKSKNKAINIALMIILLSNLAMSTNQLSAQQVEVQGELKITQMDIDDTQDNLVIKNMDGTLGTRSVASLPSPPPPIDTTRNLASDFELAKHMCECPNLPPFMIQQLLDSGYTAGDLVGAGVLEQEIIDATKFGSILDTRDNKFYNTVKIGNQVWMAENLNIGARIDGAAIPTNNGIIEKYCFDNLEANCDTYGALYPWDEMMQYVSAEGSQGICPTGWHLPTDTEWKTLEVQLGMTQVQADITGYRGTNQGSQLAGNESLWYNSVLEANELFGNSGFAAIPGGSHSISQAYFFIDKSTLAYFWSSSESASDAWHRAIHTSLTKVYRDHFLKTESYSVRCVQD